ncbi:hypothetical protein K469DRAFT_613321 [Zopfia rhizophila CBS 207.26]|uniref:RING-type E3 ubiquitin transferase n=1 Tax=Zopfia rhizophila CBS 207.26 TaxID=1314779 RepID=A0A6A6D5R5_9PEZI|nr:hypothetical protein K469DRAFT_613321 [Zopfia rhizophila CBS 207.26]
MEITAGATKDESEEVCVICLSSITERAITVPCDHYTFDFLCLVSWLQERSACPLCKTEVTAIQYDWLSPDDFKTYGVQPTHSRNPPSNTPAPQNSPSYRQARYGLYTRPRAHRRAYAPPNPDIALLRRRHVYRHKLYSLHVGSNRISRYQNLTSQMLANSPDLQSRARTWIRRELRVFSFLDPDTEDNTAEGATTSGNAEFLLTYTISILKTVDIKSSTGHAENLLQEFLGRENTRLFLHELNAWLRSPYTKLEDWDRHVQYRERLPERFDENGRGILRGKGRRWRSRSRSPDLDSRRERRERGAVRRYEPD